MNKSRIDYADRLQEVVDEYNRGALNVQIDFEALLTLAQDRKEEEKRAVSLGLSEEELALFDILMRPGPDLTPKEEDKVKQVAGKLLNTLKANKLVLDWRKSSRPRPLCGWRSSAASNES